MRRYRLAPVEATLEMLEKADADYFPETNYERMIAAAPDPAEDEAFVEAVLPLIEARRRQPAPVAGVEAARTKST